MTETAADETFNIMDENQLMTVITHQLDPQSFFNPEYPKDVPTFELLKLVMTSPKSADRLIISEYFNEHGKESFLGNNGSFYELSDFGMIQPSLSFEDIFRLFDSIDEVKTFVDEIESASTADYWMVYRCQIDEDHSTVTFIPVGRFRREDEYAVEAENGLHTDIIYATL